MLHNVDPKNVDFMKSDYLWSSLKYWKIGIEKVNEIVIGIVIESKW